MDTKIIEKIQKLLSLSESSNQNEAKIAMIKAQELLMKHKLSLKEVQSLKLNSKLKDNITDITFTKAKWKGQLANVIANNFGCMLYFKTCGTNRVVFFGKEEDVVVCNIVFTYALDTIDSCVKRLKYSLKKDGISTSGAAQDLAIGFISGLEETFNEQKKNNQEWGLVVQIDPEVIDAYNSKFNKNSKAVSINSSYQGNRRAFNSGYAEGKHFNISNKIADGDSTLMLT